MRSWLGMSVVCYNLTSAIRRSVTKRINQAHTNSRTRNASQTSVPRTFFFVLQPSSVVPES
jgi:hypothetical protein